MTYEIPKNLTSYSEEFLWGMSFKHFLYVVLFLSIIALIILKLEQVTMYVRVILCIPLFLLMVLLVFAKLDERVKSAQNLKSSLRDVGYYNPAIESFINIREIRDSSVFLKNGLVLAILKVRPIDFSILSDDRKEMVLAAYRGWLKSLDYDIQFTCRSVDVEMSPWLESLEKRAKHDKERFDAFKEWIQHTVEEKKVRNRLFYIVLPIHTALVGKTSVMADLKSLATGDYDNVADEAVQQKALKTLKNRIKNCATSLQGCDLAVKRLDNDELLSVYSSYFANTEATSESYLTPIMWLKSMCGGDQHA